MKVIKRNIATSHIGETKIMNCGEEATIISYNTLRDITVEFKKYNEIVKSDYSNFKKGRIKSSYGKTVCGVGYLGMGKYTPYDDNNIVTPQYRCWNDMIRRCYNNKALKNHDTYIGCSVCSQWLDFQAFAEWYDNNYYKVDNEEMHLDKDIICKGNKIYSPNTCVFVPQCINKIFTKNNKSRGNNPIGVSSCGSNGYQSRCGNTYLGTSNSKLEAFNKYKVFKEQFIKDKAEVYRDKIPMILYNAMCKYEVEITD